MLWSGGQHCPPAGCPLQQQQVRRMNRSQSMLHSGYTVVGWIGFNTLVVKSLPTLHGGKSRTRTLQFWFKYPRNVSALLQHFSFRILGVQRRSLSHRASISRLVYDVMIYFFVCLCLEYWIFLTVCVLCFPAADCVRTPRRVVSGATHTGWDSGESWHTKRSLEDV